MNPNRKNLANAFLAAPITAAATTMTYVTGYGAGKPAVPYFDTLTPQGQLSTMGNSEIVQVTALSGDTATIVRARKGTDAKDFPAGTIASNGIYVEDKVGSDNIDWATFAQWDVDIISNSGHSSNRTTKTSSTNSTPVYQPSYTLTNPTNKKLKMNFVLAAMGQKTSGGNTQVWIEFNGTRVSPILYYDILNTWLAFATTFSYEFDPGQTVTARVAVGGSASGGLADNSTGDLANGWPPRLVGSVARVTTPTP